MRAALQFLTAGIVLFAGVDGLLGSDRGTEIILAVKKRPTYFVSYVTEKVWLQRMQGSGVTVEPLAFFDGDQTLVLQHVGNPVTKDTLPGDWEVQLLHILEVFLERNCRHNDLKPEEIMVDGTGRLRIVDLGFASEAFGGAPLTSLFPSAVVKDLGSGYRCPSHGPLDGFSDACTLRRVMNAVRRGVEFPDDPVVLPAGAAPFPCPSLAHGRFNVTLGPSDAAPPDDLPAAGGCTLELDLSGVASWGPFEALVGVSLAACARQQQRAGAVLRVDEAAARSAAAAWMYEACAEGDSFDPRPLTDRGVDWRPSFQGQVATATVS